MREEKKREGHAVSELSNAIRKGPYGSTHEVFRKIAGKTAHGVGHPWAFCIAFSIVVAWALSGPIFHFSDTWQLVINTGTTIITFLMVFLIQNTQNRDSHALHLKLDELIRANSKARNALLAAEDLTEQELDELQREFEVLAKKKVAERESDPDLDVASHPRKRTSSKKGSASERMVPRSST